MVHFGNDWDALLAPEFEKEYYKKLRAFLKAEYSRYEIYPDMYHIFHALQVTSCANTKALILGQDPYHEPGQAHGLCFSVMRGVPQPPSLQNIYKELKADLGINPPSHGCLSAWAEQGILLLNTTLTVRRGQANSHRGQGWDTFTDAVIRLLNEADHPIAFILWGSNARAKKQLITNPIHGIFESAHPSPLSAHNGFFGSRPFSRVNAFLEKNGISPIDWAVPEAADGYVAN
ncbi:MAG: uracil-DNA glycosylase [Clostridia bacterium]|nr:uracil-DNA glycosylase [Clostridia bacterium]